MDMSIAEVRRRLTKIKIENPNLVLPVRLCGKGITAKKLQEVYNDYCNGRLTTENKASIKPNRG